MDIDAQIHVKKRINVFALAYIWKCPIVLTHEIYS